MTVLAQLAPLVLLRHVGSTDGPAHLLGATIWGAGDPPAFYDAYYAADRFPLPNLLVQYLLAGLLAVADPGLAEKLLVGGYVLAFPYALRRAALAVHPHGAWVVPLGLVFSTNTLLMFGFYNFCYGLVIYLLGVAYVLRHRTRWTPRSATVLAALLLACYLAHLVPLALLVIFVLLTTAVDLRGTPLRPFRALVSRTALPVTATLPVISLTLVFLSRPTSGSGGLGYRQLPRYVRDLVTLRLPLVTYTQLEHLPLLVLLILLALLTWRLLGRGAWPLRWQPARLALLVTLAGYLALYLVIPEGLGQGGLLHTRLSIFPPLLLLLVLAGTAPGRRLRTLSAAVGCLVALCFVAVRLPVQQQYDARLDSFVELSARVEPGSVLVGYRLTDEEPAASRFRGLSQDPLVHAPSLVATLRRGLDAGHYQGDTLYFPIRFRPGRNTYAALGGSPGIESVPPQARPSRLPDLRYVFLWHGSASLNDPGAQQLREELATGFDAVAGTPDGALVLYERRGQPAPR